MKRALPWIALVVVVVSAIVIGTRGSDSHSPVARATSIESEVRCPQCEGQSVLASNAPAAQAVRGYIVQHIAEGDSNGQIEQSLEDLYGTDILLRPPSSGVAGLVWVLPVVAFAVALGGLALAFRRWRPRERVAVSEEDRERVQAALSERDGRGEAS